MRDIERVEPNIYRRKGKRGTVYYIRYHADNRENWEKAGPTLRTARMLLTKRRAEIMQGITPRVKARNSLTFRQAIDRWFRVREAEGKRSIDRDIRSYKHLGPFFDDVPVSKITAELVERYRVQRLNEHVSGTTRMTTPATVNREVALLKAVLSRAVQWGWLDKNPIQGMAMLKEPPGRVRYLTEDEERRLMEAMQSMPLLRRVVVFAMNTGMRQGEILALRWADTDPDAGFAHIPDSKSGRRRDVPLNQSALGVLRELQGGPPEALVFATSTGRSYTNLRRDFNKALSAAGIQDFRFHDLRHTFASRLAMAGVSPLVLKELLGHSTIAMTARYSHLASAHARDAVNILDSSGKKF